MCFASQITVTLEPASVLVTATIDHDTIEEANMVGAHLDKMVAEGAGTLLLPPLMSSLPVLLLLQITTTSASTGIPTTTSTYTRHSRRSEYGPCSHR